ncbi:TPR-like protein [Cylindrobasidium torrendii FP15055 ss-10]|uniref:TPR-like protein n=1 Tax=Cylindrobasidium torrendii FP15055 ss-10 TaxID=1314674 RepID=A0A0D7B8D0_9AGAR|nr:TPR-like protein [Cylindrobasidium torrendii FP15055 ss-10]
MASTTRVLARLAQRHGAGLLSRGISAAPSRSTVLPSFARARAPGFKRWASSTTAHSTASDPAEVEANRCIEEGTLKLEEGDLEGAKGLYKRSAEIKRNASVLFNLGVTHYHLKEFDQAIAVWNESIALQPTSPDTHTNLASAYVISPVPRLDLALHHLKIATSLAPEDPEIAFNLAAVLEASGQLEEALKYYQRSGDNGVERASMHARNVSAKILGQRMKQVEEEDQKKA